jgi:hypothetical protein
MAVPQYTDLRQSDLGDVPDWAMKVLSALQQQIRFLTLDANTATYEVVSVKLTPEVWTTVRLRKIKKPATAHVTMETPAVISMRQTGSADKVDVLLHYVVTPAPTDPVTVDLFFTVK